MATNEVRSGSFVYHDTLFVEVGDGKRHLRASASELKDLLLPKKNAVPAKDQVAHWYEAKLIHYGLPRVMDKNAAKVHLLGAVNADGLKVPSDIQQLEADLKKQYASSQRKAKNASKKTETAVPVSSAKKRKATDMEASQSSTTKMSFTLGGMTFNIDHATSSASSKTSKKPKTTATATTEEAAPKATIEKQPSKTTAAKAATSSPSVTAKPSTVKPKSKPGNRVKHVVQGVNQHKCNECRRESERQPLGARPVARVGNHPSTPQTARRSRPHNHSAARPAPTLARDPSPIFLYSDHEEAPPPYTKYDDNDNDEDEDSESDVSDTPKMTQMSGVYTISTPSEDNAELLVRLSHARDQLWGSFTLASKTGIIRLDNIDNIAGSVRKSFGWRSEDCDAGHLRFGKGCDGWIEFNGGGGVRGAFHGFTRGQDLAFEGGLQEGFEREDNEEKEEAIAAWATEWHEFPERAYGRR